MTDRSWEAGGRGSDEMWLDIPPRTPDFLRRTTAAAPIALGGMFLMAICFLPLFRPAQLFAVVLMPPFTACSWGLWSWARGKKLTGDREADRQTVLETSAAYLAFQSIFAPMVSILFFFLSLESLLWGGVIGTMGYALIVLAYFSILIASIFVFPRWYVDLEVDRLSREPGTALGRLLSPQLRVPRPAAVAGPFLVLLVVLQAVLSQAWQAAFLAGMGLTVALVMTLPSATALHRFRRVWRIREGLSAPTK